MTERGAIHTAISNEVEWTATVKWNDIDKQFELSRLIFDLEFTDEVMDLFTDAVNALINVGNGQIREQGWEVLT